MLDEVCNHNNDAYGDEVLYGAWIGAQRDDPGFIESSELAESQPK